MKEFMLKKLIAPVLISVILSACGGSDSTPETPTAAAGPAPSPGVAPVSTLSTNQQELEKSLTVAGGYVNPGWNLPSTGAAVVGTHYFGGGTASAIASPSTGPQTSTFSFVNYGNTTGLPPYSTFTPTRYLKSGKIVYTPITDSKVIYRYVGGDAFADYLASDGAPLPIPTS
jgi:hypothetical protein